MANWWDNLTGYWLGDQENRQELISTSSPVPDLLFSTPEEVDPRKLYPSHPWPESQLQQGACAGHARANVVEWCYAIASGESPVQLSRQYSYIDGQRYDGLLGRDVGATINGQRRSAMEGTPPETVWGYTGRYHTSPPAPQTWATVQEAAKQYRIAKHAVLRSYDDVFRWLAMGTGGVVIGIRWSLGDGAIVESYRPGGGGHAVAFMGYTRRKDSQGRNYVLLLNSWGERWGNRGWAEIAPVAIEQMLRDSYTVMIGLTDMVDVKPRRVDFTKWGTK